MSWQSTGALIFAALCCRADVAVTCDWAPDGRHFLTATVAPRLRVDNGYQIWRSVFLLLCILDHLDLQFASAGYPMGTVVNN